MLDGSWTTRWAVGWLAAVAALGLASSGCTTSCEELQAVCDECEDPAQKASCEQSVDRADQELCDTDVTSFCAVCGRRGAAVVEACK